MDREEEIIFIHLWDFLLAIFLCILFIWLTGLGGKYYQTWDNHARNAIFRDLIYQAWPVIYEKTGNALVYYHIFWMFPAWMGKLFGWDIANIVLFLQGVLFSAAILLNISIYLHKKKINHRLFVIAVIFIIWGGLNILGQAISQTIGWCNSSVYFGTNEGWLDFSRNGFDCSYLYRSNYDAICQVYNQAFPAWLVILIYLNDRKICNCAFIGLCLLPYGPIPFIGAFFIIFAEEGRKLIKGENGTLRLKYFKQAFSIQNISAVAVAVLFLLYFSCSISGSNITWYVPYDQYNIERVVTLLLFYFFEFGIFSILLCKKYKKDSLFWILNLNLLWIPFIKIGYGRDFCMNASFPALMLLMVYVTESLYSFLETEKYVKMAVIICLCYSAITPCFGILEKAYYMRMDKCFPYVADLAYSYSERTVEETDFDPFNYLCPEPYEKFFYRYVAK